MSRSPSRSGSPPSLRIAKTERIRCWLAPRRPVTPSIAMRSVLVAMIVWDLLLGGAVQFGRATGHRALAALEHSGRFAQFGDRLPRARRFQHGHVGRIAERDAVV